MRWLEELLKAQDLLFVRFWLVELIGETEEEQRSGDKDPHGKSWLHCNIGSRGKEREKCRRYFQDYGALISIARDFYVPAFPSLCVCSRAHKANFWLWTSGVRWAGRVCKCCLNARPGRTAPGGPLTLRILVAWALRYFQLDTLYVIRNLCDHGARGRRRHSLLKMEHVSLWPQR